MAQYAKIAFDYNSNGKWSKNGICDISVRKDETVVLLDAPDGGWIRVRTESNGTIGYVPENYLRKINNPNPNRNNNNTKSASFIGPTPPRISPSDLNASLTAPLPPPINLTRPGVKQSQPPVTRGPPAIPSDNSQKSSTVDFAKMGVTRENLRGFAMESPARLERSAEVPQPMQRATSFRVGPTTTTDNRANMLTRTLPQPEPRQEPRLDPGKFRPPPTTSDMVRPPPTTSDMPRPLPKPGATKTAEDAPAKTRPDPVPRKTSVEEPPKTPRNLPAKPTESLKAPTPVVSTTSVEAPRPKPVPVPRKDSDSQPRKLPTPSPNVRRSFDPESSSPQDIIKLKKEDLKSENSPPKNKSGEKTNSIEEAKNVLKRNDSNKNINDIKNEDNKPTFGLRKVESVDKKPLDSSNEDNKPSFGLRKVESVDKKPLDSSNDDNKSNNFGLRHVDKKPLDNSSEDNNNKPSFGLRKVESVDKKPLDSSNEDNKSINFGLRNVDKKPLDNSSEKSTSFGEENKFNTSGLKKTDITAANGLRKTFDSFPNLESKNKKNPNTPSEDSLKNVVLKKTEPKDLSSKKNMENSKSQSDSDLKHTFGPKKSIDEGPKTFSEAEPEQVVAKQPEPHISTELESVQVKEEDTVVTVETEPEQTAEEVAPTPAVPPPRPAPFRKQTPDNPRASGRYPAIRKNTSFDDLGISERPKEEEKPKPKPMGLFEFVDEDISMSESEKLAVTRSMTMVGSKASLMQNMLRDYHNAQESMERDRSSTAWKVSPSSPQDIRGSFLGSFNVESANEEEKDLEGITLTEHKGKKMIKGAHIDKLVDQLYGQSNIGTDFLTEYVDTFLLTYRTFTTPKEVFTMLSASYLSVTNKDDEKSKAKKLRICNFLKRWMENHYYDFEGDQDLFAEYHVFVEKLSQIGGETAFVGVLKKAITKGQNKSSNLATRTWTVGPPKPIVPKTLTIMDVDAVEMARQITLLEFELFSSVPVKEFLIKNWQKAELQVKSPHILKIVERFNTFSTWIAFAVLNEFNLKKRAAIMSRFIKIAKECLTLNNFNAVFEISAGLQQSSIYRLKKTWEIVKKEKEYSKAWDEITALTSNQSSFALYREKLHNSNGAILPYLGVYQTDIVFIHEGNPDFIEDQKINFFKRRLLSEVIREIQVYQQGHYNLMPLDNVLNWLRSNEFTTDLDDDGLYKISLEIEPRDGSIPTSKPTNSVSSPKDPDRGSLSAATGKSTKSKLQKLLGEGAPQLQTKQRVVKSESQAELVIPPNLTSTTTTNAPTTEENVDNSLAELQAQLDSLNDLTFDES